MLFSDICSVFDAMETTRSRLELTSKLAELFKKTNAKEIKKVIYLCQGRLVPSHLAIELGMGEKLAEEAIAIVSGKNVKEVDKKYRELGDLGDTAEELIRKRSQHSFGTSELSVAKVYDNFYKIATASGSGSQDAKIKLLAELLNNASETEPKTIVRFVTGSLRLGIAEATILDALSVMQSGSKELRESLERAFNLTSDLGLVAELLFEKGMEAVEATKPMPFNPIRPALAERLPDATAIIEKLGECAVEAKYDGFRVQCHKKGDKVAIYSRKQEPMTHMFPDVVEAIKKQIKAKEAIFEGEAIGYNEATDTYSPFQETITRKRKHGVAQKAKDLPLHLFAFELLYLDGTDYTRKPFNERRAKLEKIIDKNTTPAIITTSNYELISTAKRLEEFFESSVENGLEGIIAKDLAAPYTAGARKFSWIKLKKSYQGHLADTLDLVVVGYYSGKGKRTQFGFGGLLAAVYDADSDKFKTIARIGTGFTEKEMQWFHDTLEKLKTKQKPTEVESKIEPDFWVKPKIVITVTADEITKSPMHTCAEQNGTGLALRFPRLESLREDKQPRDATTQTEAVSMFEMQRKATETI